jgi:hypothetical protein
LNDSIVRGESAVSRAGLNWRTRRTPEDGFAEKAAGNFLSGPVAQHPRRASYCR